MNERSVTVMNEEIERKYLVTDPRWREAIARADRIRIEQGYLCATDDLSVRVRINDERATLTVKGATRGYTRAEFEYGIPADDARALLELCPGYNIKKWRYLVEHAGREWVVDEFDGDNEGLVVAEVELDDEDEDLVVPDWLGEEVSGRPEYYNSNLSRRPYRKW